MAENVNDRPKVTPPKSDEVLRAKLASISSSPTEVSRGSLFDRQGHRVLLTSFYSFSQCREFQSELGKHNIHTARHQRRNQYELSVDEEDRQAAGELLVAFRAVHPNVRDAQSHRKFDATVLLAAIFGGVALALATTERNMMSAFVVGLRFALLGGVVGFLIDQLRRKERSGLVTTFLVVAIIAILLWLVLSWIRFLGAPA